MLISPLFWPVNELCCISLQGGRLLSRDLELELLLRRAVGPAIVWLAATGPQLSRSYGWCATNSAPSLHRRPGLGIVPSAQGLHRAVLQGIWLLLRSHAGSLLRPALLSCL